MKTTFFKMAAVAAFVLVASATAQNTAYVPFVVNADATVTARQDETVISMSVKANEESVLILPNGVTSVWNTGGTQGRLNAPLITSSRGNITLRLPPQPYQNAEIAMYSVNGRQILRGKASATETASGISRRNVAAGAYLLSVKGTNGNAFTTRLTHNGGDMNINMAFGAESVSQSPARKLGKQAATGDWEITISADGYIAQTYALRAVIGINNRQVINLDPVPQPTTYTLTIAATAGGSVSPSVGAHTYDAGAFVTVTANANSGYTFKGWSGASTSTSATVNITMDGNKTLTADFQQNDTPTPTITTFTDSRDGKTYKKVTIGIQTWMAENLNYDVDGSACYDNDPENCTKYGRLYMWEAAKSACPTGWHLPSYTVDAATGDWNILSYGVRAGQTGQIGQKLKATSGWNYVDPNYGGNGTDDYGFSALPGGSGAWDGYSWSFWEAGVSGYWWIDVDTVSNDDYAKAVKMEYGNHGVAVSGLQKSWLGSVRCVQD